MSHISDVLIEILYKGLREAIPSRVEYADGLPDVDFSPPENDFLFYQVKHGGKWAYWLDEEAFKALQAAPFFDDDPGPMGDGFYADLIGDKSYPNAYQRSASPLDCFLKNAPALCRHTSDATAELDLSYLSKYDVRSGFRPYGGKAKLSIKDGNYSLDSVENSNAADQEEAKNIFFSSFAVHVVFARHAVMTHLSVAQRLLIKFTLPSEAHKVATNPRLNTLLQVLTTRVNEVSVNEHLLIGTKGLVARASSFTDDGLLQAGKDVYDSYAAMAPADLVALLGDGSKQWKTAVANGWHAARTLVGDLQLGADISESDAELLALDVFVSSFYHEFIGDLQLDNLIKGNLPFPCTGKPHRQTRGYAIQSTTIAVTTMTRMYSVDEVPSVIDQADMTSIEAWQKYGETLASLDTGIDQFIGTGAFAGVNF